MAQIQSFDRRGRYIPSLEGIRGYGFLLVFCGHYFLPSTLAHPGTLRLKFLSAFVSLGLFAVPGFFVLSGYLIGGILYDTRNREGFFKVFYFRRVIRVFPVFYATLLVIALYATLHGIHLTDRFWIHFLYIQNLLPHYAAQHNPVGMVHFWSLAVEEQFYLLWPVVVWLFPERKKLIAIAGALILTSCVLRLIAPFVVASSQTIEYFTPTRADAILLGVLLSLIRGEEIFERMKRWAKWAILPGTAAMMSLGVTRGEAWAQTVMGQEVWIPLANFTAFAVVLAVLEEGSWLNRACSQTWACWLGRLSYSSYVIHLTFVIWVDGSLVPYFATHMRHSFAVLAGGGVAFVLTFGLSLLSLFCLEMPAFKLRKLLRYGAERSRQAEGISELVLAKTG